MPVRMPLITRHLPGPLCTRETKVTPPASPRHRNQKNGDQSMNQTAVLLIVVAVVVFLAVVGVALVRRTKQKRSERLRTRFGPEYDRVLTERGDRTAAEKALEEREKRSRKIVIRPLS